MKQKLSISKMGDKNGETASKNKRILPRVPEEVSGIQVNFCKNLKCTNFGSPASTEYPKRGRGNVSKDNYTLGNSKAKKSLRCKICRQETRLQSNLAIAEELERISSYLDKTDMTPSSCPNPDCINNPSSVNYDPQKALARFRKNGKDNYGTQRYKCSDCGKVFSVAAKSPIRFQRKSHKNRKIFKLLVNKTPLSRICEIEEISPLTLYSKIDFLRKQCLAFAADRERAFLEGKVKTRTYGISVDQQVYVVNWTQRLDKRNVFLYSASSADNRTGYVFGSTVNFDPDFLPDEIEAKARACGDQDVPFFFRQYPRFWLREDYIKEARKNRNKKQKTSSSAYTLMDKIENKYLIDLDREYPEIFEEMNSNNKLPAKGMLIRAEYTLYAHLFFLKNLLQHAEKVCFYLDQDSSLRNACICAFKEEILARKCDAFHVSINKDMTVDQRRRQLRKAKQKLQRFHSSHPHLNEWDLKLRVMEDQIKFKRYPAKVDVKHPWHWDGWVDHPLPRLDEPEKKVCYLTDLGDLDDATLAGMMLRAGMYGVDTYFQQLRRRLSLLERPISSSSNTGRRWFGYSPYNPGMIQKMLDIFRVYHNYVLRPAGEMDPKRKQETPAMRMGLARGPVAIEKILYFRG